MCGDLVIWYVNHIWERTRVTAPFSKEARWCCWWNYSCTISSHLLSVSSIWSATVSCKALICEDCSRIMKQTVARDTRLVTKELPPQVCMCTGYSCVGIKGQYDHSWWILFFTDPNSGVKGQQTLQRHYHYK